MCVPGRSYQYSPPTTPRAGRPCGTHPAVALVDLCLPSRHGPAVGEDGRRQTGELAGFSAWLDSKDTLTFWVASCAQLASMQLSWGPSQPGGLLADTVYMASAHWASVMDGRGAAPLLVRVPRACPVQGCSVQVLSWRQRLSLSPFNRWGAKSLGRRRACQVPWKTLPNLPATHLSHCPAPPGCTLAKKRDTFRFRSE